MQESLHYSDNKIIKIIERIYLFNNKEDLLSFFPKNIDCFKQDIQYLRKIKRQNPKCIVSLVKYKDGISKIINNILVRKQFPLVYIAPLNFINDTRYLFPNDVYKFKAKQEKMILDCINNIDNVILNNKTLDDTLLFRGIYEPNSKKSDNNN